MQNDYGHILDIFENKRICSDLSESDVHNFKLLFDGIDHVEFIKFLDDSYESGSPLVTDDLYDFLIMPVFSEYHPEHELLSRVRPEPENLNLEKVVHSRPMLSTNKAYDIEDFVAWCNKVQTAADSININAEDILFSVTPKLDGNAGRHESGVLVTRGRDGVGFNVTHLYDIGVIPLNGIADGDGELVMSSKYFDENLKDIFSHPRNAMSGIVKADDLSETRKKILDDGAAYFIRYSEMEKLTFNISEMLSMEAPYDHFFKQLITVPDFEFPIDGFVITVDNAEIRDEMGHNNSFHNWMLAVKKRGEAKNVTVTNVVLQTGRTGRITPVIEIEPTLLSGATVKRVTAHNLKLLSQNGIGEGAVIKVIRSGEVIPYIQGVVTPSNHVVQMVCPSCGENIEQISDSIYECLNKTKCPAQLSNSITHHFKTLDIKNFGGKTANKLVDSGLVKVLSDVYSIKHEDLVKIGFGDRQSEILISERDKIINNPQSPDRLMASFGIKGLGVRACSSLLEHIDFKDLYSGNFSIEDISGLENFGNTSARQIYVGIQESLNTISKIMSMGVSIKEKEIIVSDSFISGKNIIFTGTMHKAGRKDMEKEAISLGANIQSSINKKTDYLIAGDKAGSKMEKAKKLGIEILTEDQYLEILGK